MARTIGVVAQAVGCSSRNVSEWLARGCPGEPERYVIPEIVAWAKSNVWAKPDPVDGDPLMGEGGDSVWLERYREEKTLLARLERQQKEGNLVRVDELMNPLMEAAALIREAGERIGREQLAGSDAQEVVNEAVGEFVAGLKRIGGEE